MWPGDNIFMTRWKQKKKKSKERNQWFSFFCIGKCLLKSDILKCYLHSHVYFSLLIWESWDSAKQVHDVHLLESSECPSAWLIQPPPSFSLMASWLNFWIASVVPTRVSILTIVQNQLHVINFKYNEDTLNWNLLSAFVETKKCFPFIPFSFFPVDFTKVNPSCTVVILCLVIIFYISPFCFHIYNKSLLFYHFEMVYFYIWNSQLFVLTLLTYSIILLFSK